MPTLITGSFAYDTIMVFQDQFKNHILPDQVHILNVCFFVPDMRKEFGGCSGNISYNLKLLGGDPLPMGTVGEDFKPYRKWLKKQDIDITHITEVENTYTAQAFLTTDTDNNQIIAFHPGAMNYAHKNRVGDARGVTLGIVAPDGRDAMVEHAEQFAEAGIPWIFDPGQGLPMFSGEELMTFVEQATYLCVNDYESRLLVDKTGRNLPDIAAEVDALIVTCGGSGAEIMVDGTTLD
ncbi:MAG: carbohydrate kinase family protein, partial [Gammaproteobacteria bacterium]|nr:carbohydrate kinase family protein [Gammaproteobacteria bacterium]